MTQNDMLRRTVAARRASSATTQNAVVQQPAPAKDLTPAQRCYQTLMRPDTIAKIATALPRGIDANRFMRVVWTECRKNQSLVNATPDSLISSCITAAQLGLEVGSHLGQAYLVPFSKRVNTGKEWRSIPQAQLIIGYRGLITLARKSGEMVSLNAYVVHEKDHFSYQLGLHPDIQHIPTSEADPGPLTYVYAVANFVGGGVQFEVMSRAEIEAVRDKSQGYISAKKTADKYKKDVDSPWVGYFEEMAKKTAIRRLAKYLPLSVEASRAVAVDEAADRGEFLDDVIDQEYVTKGGEPPAYVGDFEDIDPELEPTPEATEKPATETAKQSLPPEPPFPEEEALATMSPADIKRKTAQADPEKLF